MKKSNKKFEFNTSDFEPIKSDRFKPHDFEPISKKDEFPWPNKPFVGRSPTPEETQKTGQDAKEGAAGFAQGLANIPSDTINLVNPTSHNVPRFDFAPDTNASKVGQFSAPFLGPQALEYGAAKTVSYIPKAVEWLNKLSQVRKTSPVKNALLNSAKTGGSVGYVNALEHPENPKQEFAKGFGTGAGLSLLAPAALSGIPFVGTAAKMGAGAIIGNEFGHPWIGAVTAAGLPISKFAGLESKNKVAEDMLSGLTEKDVSKSVTANRRLGTNVTPAEASGNYVKAGEEGALKRTAGGGQAGYRYEEGQKIAQGNAVSRMLDKIYKPTAENEDKINALYKKAEHSDYDLDPVEVNAMLQNPVMKKAVDSVMLKPSYSEMAPNNYGFLAEVERTLGRQYNGLKYTDPNSAYDVLQVKNVFSNILKQKNPAYAEAAAAAQPKIVRRNLEEKINKEEEDYTAKSVYSKLLNSRKTYREVLKDTKNFPEAQQDIKDMRAGWKNLANMKTTSQAESQGKTAIDQMRNLANYFHTYIKNVAGAKADKARLKFINTAGWENSFDNLAKIKDKKKRINSAIQIITNYGSKAGLGSDEIQNMISMTQEDNE